MNNISNNLILDGECVASSQTNLPVGDDHKGWNKVNDASDNRKNANASLQVLTTVLHVPTFLYIHSLTRLF